jgi:hypothetical protein
MRMPPLRQLVAALLLGLLLFPPRASAYSVLSHEQVVDLAWTTHIVPLLQARYPTLTPEQLKEAHAYAYGGSIIQDIGYYPFGSHQLSDMLHYVRSGDFVSNLIREANSADEYAFALGALAHYTSDTYGHPAVNQATAREFPKLRERFGPVVTYAQDPSAHLRTEFGFDVLEVAQRRYAPQAYHDFIGFQVAKPVFERAFADTYGLDLNQVMTHEDLAIGTYRRTVSILLPKMTQVAYADYRKQIEQTEPTYVPKRLIYRLSKADYKKDWDENYQQPGIGARLLGTFLRLLPKIGPLKDLSLRVPDPATQKQFLTGMDTVVDRYHDELDVLKKEPKDSPSLALRDIDLDTGKPTAPGEYSLADQSYARYLHAAVQHPDKPLPPDARADLLHFFEQPTPVSLKLKKAQWKSLLPDLLKLQQMSSQPPQNRAQNRVQNQAQNQAQNPSPSTSLGPDRIPPEEPNL